MCVYVFNCMWIENFQMCKLDLVKAEEPEIKLPTSIGVIKKKKKKQREFWEFYFIECSNQGNNRKTSISALLITPKPLTVWITTNFGKFFKTWKYQTILTASRETCMQIKNQQLESDME